MPQLRMKEHPYNGLLITFCGLDGCGKTTLIEQLVAYFCSKGVDPVITKQPTKVIRQSVSFRKLIDCPNQEAYCHQSVALMAAGDRIQHVHEVIEPALKNGKVVISDRYFYSCLAHLKAGGFEKDNWIYEMSESILKPDVPFFVDVPLDTAISRVRQREREKDRYIDMDFQQRVHREYHIIARQENAFVLHSDWPLESTVEEMIRVVEQKSIAKGGVCGEFLHSGKFGIV